MDMSRKYLQLDRAKWALREEVEAIDAAKTERRLPALSTMRALHAEAMMLDTIGTADLDPDYTALAHRLGRDISAAVQTIRTAWDSLEGRQSLVYCSRIGTWASSGRTSQVPFPAVDDRAAARKLDEYGPWALSAVSAAWKAWAQCIANGMSREESMREARLAGQFAATAAHPNGPVRPLGDPEANGHTGRFLIKVSAVIGPFVDEWATPVTEEDSERRILLVVRELLSSEAYTLSPPLVRFDGHELLAVPAGSLIGGHNGITDPGAYRQSAEVHAATLRLVVGGLSPTDAYQAALDIHTVTTPTVTT